MAVAVVAGRRGNRLRTKDRGGSERQFQLPRHAFLPFLQPTRRLLPPIYRPPECLFLYQPASETTIKVTPKLFTSKIYYIIFLTGSQPHTFPPNRSQSVLCFLFCFVFSFFVSQCWCSSLVHKHSNNFPLLCIGQREPIYSGLVDEEPSIDTPSSRDRDIGSPLV